MNLNEEIEELKQKIKMLERQLPKHSISASMLLKIEELEEKLEKLESRKRES